MRVLALANQKGGCGKTTSAINLAASLAHLGKRTLLIDLDPQAHATFGLGMRKEDFKSTIYNVLTEDSDKRDFIENAIVPVDANLDLVPAHILLSTIEQEFVSKDEAVSQLHEVLTRLSFPYDWVLVDCPPSLGFLTFNALRAAQYVIMPVDLGAFSLMGVGKLLSMIELIQLKIGHAPKVYALPTMVDMRTRFTKEMMQEIQRTFGAHVLNAFVHQTVSVKESQAKGEPLLRCRPRSKGAIDYLLLAQEITEKFRDREAERLIEEPRQNGSPPKRLLDFALKAESAKEVYLVGDFNDWNLSPESLLWQKEEGLWQRKLLLNPGRYRYKFVVDGQWTNDPASRSFEPNPYGGTDSLIEVE